MSLARRIIRRARFVAVAANAAALTRAISAQTLASWLTPVDGSWTDGSRWSTNPNFPSGNYDATINAIGTPYMVSLPTSITINNFTLDSTDATLLQTATLTTNGTASINSGTLILSLPSALVT